MRSTERCGHRVRPGDTVPHHRGRHPGPLTLAAGFAPAECSTVIGASTSAPTHLARRSAPRWSASPASWPAPSRRTGTQVLGTNAARQRLTGGADVTIDCVGSADSLAIGCRHPTDRSGGDDRDARRGPRRPDAAVAARDRAGRRARLRHRALRGCRRGPPTGESRRTFDGFRAGPPGGPGSARVGYLHPPRACRDDAIGAHAAEAGPPWRVGIASTSVNRPAPDQHTPDPHTPAPARN